MATSMLTDTCLDRTDWTALADELGPRFAVRAAAHDRDDSFVALNYAELKARRAFSAGVPAELGGGASHAALCGLVRALAHHCGSTALAFSMHTHQVALAAWRWRQGQTAVEPFLRRVAAEELVLASGGGSDWLPGSGTAERVEGGYRLTARKVFSSGCPGADVMMTCAVLDEAEAGPSVLHFPVSLRGEGVRILDTWHTLGMRGTGSHDVELDGVFVPEATVGARRPAGVWNPLFHALSMLAFPLIYSAYAGLAEAARAIAVREALPRREDAGVQLLVGEMETELAAARCALASMIDTAASAMPGPETTGAIMTGRHLVGRAAIAAVDKAMEVAGGRAFYRTSPLERIFRDVQAARYHPLQAKPLHRYAGRLALGLSIDG
jgi:acyl-CoA dehydrogenase